MKVSCVAKRGFLLTEIKDDHSGSDLLPLLEGAKVFLLVKDKKFLPNSANYLVSVSGKPNHIFHQLLYPSNKGI